MAIAFLGDGADSMAAPLPGIEPPDRNACDPDGVGPGRQPLAGQGLEKLVLAVAGDPGDTEHLTGADGEGEVAQIDPVEVIGG